MDGETREIVLIARHCINCTIWDFVASVSAVNGLVCFALGDNYKNSLGKLGKGGLVIYLSVGLIVWMLIRRTQKIKVGEEFHALVLALTFGLTCFVSTTLEMLQTEKADVFSIISYGSFALMSLSMSRESKLGFETGFSSFFLSLFASQFPKINQPLSPIAIVLCSVIFYLFRSTQRGGGLHHSTNQNGDAHLTDVEQGQDPPRMLEPLRHDPSPGNNWPINVSWESILNILVSDNQQNMEEEKDRSSLTTESSNDRISLKEKEQTKQCWYHRILETGLRRRRNIRQSSETPSSTSHCVPANPKRLEIKIGCG